MLRRFLIIAGGLCAAFVFGASAAQAGSVTFAPGPSFPTTDFVSHLGVGDFNRDRDPDLVFSAFGGLSSEKAGTLLGGQGVSFAPEVPLQGTQDLSYEIATGDFNRDGNLDLALAKFSTTTGVAIYVGGPGGSFGPPSYFPTGSNFPYGGLARAVAVGDVNRDGDLDLLIANNFDDVVLLLGGAGASFGPPQPVVSSSFNTDVALADFNGDQDLDVAVTNGESNSVEVVLGGPGTTFHSFATYGVGETPWDIEVADFDQNGDPDLAVSNRVAAGPALFVLRGGPGGTFSAAPQVDPGRDGHSLAVGDLNRDGDPDVAYLSFKSGVDEAGVIRIALGGPGATFTSPVSVSAWPGFVPDAITMADFDLDADLDFAVGLGRSILTLINTTPPPLPGSKAECMNGGWTTFGVFKNQGDCVSFVATGGKNPPAGR